MGKGGILAWKTSQQGHGERQQHRIFLYEHKMDQVLAGIADNSQVSALLVAGVKNPRGKINCYQYLQISKHECEHFPYYNILLLFVWIPYSKQAESLTEHEPSVPHLQSSSGLCCNPKAILTSVIQPSFETNRR